MSKEEDRIKALEKKVKSLEKQVKQTERQSKKYKALFENAPLGLFRADESGTLLDINLSMAQILGYRSIKSALNDLCNLSNFIPDFSGLLSELKHKSRHGDRLYTFQKQLKKKGNILIEVNLTIKVLTDAQKDLKYLEGFIENITKRKETEQKLIVERNQLRAVIDNIPDFIYVKNLEGQYILANKILSRWVKSISGEKVIGNYDRNIFPEQVAKEFIEDDNLVFDNQKIINKDEQRLGDFSNIAIYTTKIPLKDDGNKIIGVVGISRNLTDLKTAQEKIRSSQTNLKAVIESTSNAIWSVDRDYNLIEGNTAFKKIFTALFGLKVRSGQNILKSLPDNEKITWKSYYDAAFKGNQWHEELSYDINCERYQFNVTFNPIYSASKKITGATVFAQDISLRKKAEAKVRESEVTFKQFADNTSDAFLMLENNRVIYSNPGFKIIYGRDVKQNINPDEFHLQWIHPQDKTRIKRKLISKQYQVKRKLNTQFRIIKPNGEITWIWVRSSLITTDQGVKRTIIVSSDITQQKELELKLIQVQNQQKALLDNIPYLAWVKDLNKRYTLVNKPFAKKYNTTPEAVIGKTDFDFSSEEKALEHERSDNEVRTQNKRLLFHDHDPVENKWIETYKAPIYNELGKIIGITGISRDITSQKTIEDAIRGSEERFRALLQNSSDAITLLNKKGEITFESSLKSKTSEYTIDELVGKKFQDFIHPEDKESIIATLKVVSATPDKEIKREYRSLHKNRKWIYVESIFINKLDNPDINGIVVNTRNTTERKMAELRERVYHDNLIFLSNSALDLLGLSSKDDIYKYISVRLNDYLENAVVIVSAYNDAEALFSIESVRGVDDKKEDIRSLLKKTATDIRFPVLTDIKDHLFTGKLISLNFDEGDWEIEDFSRKEYEFIKRMLGINKVYSINLARHNKLLGNVTILTRQKAIVKFKHIIETFLHQVSVALHRSQLEYELIRAKEKAEESDKLKSAFLANMSHEIRTPMNGILGFAELLNEDELSPGNRKKYIEIINNNGKMLINLIDDIIDFSKIEAGQIKIIQKVFSLNSMLQQVHSSFLTENLIHNKAKVKLRMRKALSNEKCYIHSDPNRLRQILTNLVGNAFKFTEEGYIEFGYRLINENTTLEFYVKDTGIGIPEDKLRHIFDRFVQADSSPTRKYGGSGLGLPISKGFVEMLGGEMWAESSYGEGSVFSFTMPYKPAEKTNDETKEKVTPKKQYNWSDRVILVAEDDRFSYKFLEGFLNQTQASVIHAENGKKAVDLCLEIHDIDLVLMDIQMPEMNGYEATALIKQSRKDLPVIAQTANAIFEEKEKCYEAGCDDFVTKPINIRELYAKIDNFFKTRVKS